MPPKPKFTRDEIVGAALELVSEKGIDALTARELGERLGSSARPIFTVFKNMDELKVEVRKAAMARFEASVGNTDNDMPQFKQIGMQMVKFAVEQPRLYQFLFMQKNQAAESFEDVFGELGETARQCIDFICRDYSLAYDKARALFENVWIYTFGVGALCATGVCRFSQERLGDMLTTEFRAMLSFIESDSDKQ